MRENKPMKKEKQGGYRLWMLGLILLLLIGLALVLFGPRGGMGMLSLSGQGSL